MINNIFMNEEKINKDNLLLINFDNNIDNNINKINNLTINSSSELSKMIKYYLFLSNKSYIYQYSKVKTDKGFINIEDINLNKNTINNKKIVSISKNNIKEKKKYILFKKDSIDKNIPSYDTIIDSNQEIFYDNKYIEAKIFLVKYSENVNIIELEDINMYNILLEDDSNININNLLLKSLNLDFNDYINDVQKKYYETNWNNLKDKELFNHWQTFGKYENKYMFYKKEFKKEEVDLEGYKNKYKDLSNLNNDQLWNHWIKNGKKESRHLYYKLTKDKADLKKYKNDYQDLFSYNDDQLWNHWTKKGKKENRNMYFKFKMSEIDLNKYKKDYLELDS